MMTNQNRKAAPIARLTSDFLARVEATGLTDSAAAAAIGVTRQQYSAIKLGHEQPTTRFIVGAITAGLAESFADVAEVVERSTQTAAA